MTIEVTDAALAAVTAARKADDLPDDACLRVAVKSGGCSGLSYTLSFVAAPAAGDHLIEKDGVRFVIDRESETYLDGTTLDYESGLQGKGFTFSNPKASRSCGCGQSFAV